VAREMKITVAVNGFFPDVRGGGQNYALSLAKGLKARDHDAWFLVGRPGRGPGGVLRCRRMSTIRSG
jgi:hypothetical protein